MRGPISVAYPEIRKPDLNYRLRDCPMLWNFLGFLDGIQACAPDPMMRNDQHRLHGAALTVSRFKQWSNPES